MFTTLFLLVFSTLSACTYLPSGSVLFKDDFSTPYEGWSVGEDSAGIVGFSEQSLVIYLKERKSIRLSTPGLDFKAARIEVDASKAAGPDDNDFGIICGYKHESNFYFLEISSDGYYGIGQNQQGETTLISADKMQSSDYIHQGETINQLRADCADGKLILYVNGFQIARVEGYNDISGGVGLIAGTLDAPGVGIRFDNFIVYVP